MSAVIENDAGAWPDNLTEVPYWVFTSQEVFEREQERIYRGPFWSFIALEDEIPNVGDYKSTFIGATPVVVTRGEDGEFYGWVNRCAHRGATLCRQLKGNATTHTCIYHQWAFDSKGDLIGVPFRRGVKGKGGYPKDFKNEDHGLTKIRVENYKGLLFGTFDGNLESVPEYVGPSLLPYVDRVLHKPLKFLGTSRQYGYSNWKLYFENVKDPYHASLLHLFHATFGILRVSMGGDTIKDDKHGLSSIITVYTVDNEDFSDYKKGEIRSYNEDVKLSDPSLLVTRKEYEREYTNSINSIFPGLVIQQIHNTLAARQIVPKGPGEFELIFHFFGYQDDDAEMTALRLKQANLVGPAGFISMEDTEATECVQRANDYAPRSDRSYIGLGGDSTENVDNLVNENLIRAFWKGYREVMGY